MGIKFIFLLITISLISACGSGTENNADSKVVEAIVPEAFGQIVDSTVGGLKYASGQYEGITDENGRFGYLIGEQIQFFIGDIEVGFEIEPKALLTPYDLASGNSFGAINIARFLQSLDDDNELSNGIQIHPTSHSLAELKEIDFLSQEWELSNLENSSIEQLIYLLTSETSSGSRYSVNTSDAYYHFASTLDNLMNNLELQIVDELDATGCLTNSECKSYSLTTSFIGFCPPGDTIYIYSETNTEFQKIDNLAEERNGLKTVKSELRDIANIPILGGLCTSFQVPQYPICNEQSRCEFIDSIPIE